MDRCGPLDELLGRLTRRSLLRTGAISSAATLVGLRPLAATPAAAAPGHLLRSSYAGLEGQNFTAGSVDLRLLSVSDVAGSVVDESLAGSEDAFVLEFSGPLEAGLSTGAHSLTHPALGTFELFVSPVEQPRADRRYEAVVDRSVGTSVHAEAPGGPGRTSTAALRGRVRWQRPKRRVPAAPACELAFGS